MKHIKLGGFVACNLFKFLKTVAEKTEGREYENTICALVLELLCYIDNRISGGNHVVDDDNVLSLYVST